MEDCTIGNYKNAESLAKICSSCSAAITDCAECTSRDVCTKCADEMYLSPTA